MSKVLVQFVGSITPENASVMNNLNMNIDVLVIDMIKEVKEKFSNLPPCLKLIVINRHYQYSTIEQYFNSIPFGCILVQNANRCLRKTKGLNFSQTVELDDEAKDVLLKFTSMNNHTDFEYLPMLNNSEKREIVIHDLHTVCNYKYRTCFGDEYNLLTVYIAGEYE